VNNRKLREISERERMKFKQAKSILDLIRDGLDWDPHLAAITITLIH
jgi:hypothetical protein